jgi:hypothetical protein
MWHGQKGYFNGGKSQVGQYHLLHLSLSNQSNRYTNLAQHMFRSVLQTLAHTQKRTLAELFAQVEEATTTRDLTRAVNCIQEYLWELPAGEQSLPRQRLATALSDHVLHATESTLRLEAASWLRTLIQAGFIQQPEEVFVTLVTAATYASRQNSAHELESYLKMIFDSFWPFRYPYPVFTWEKFPTNEVFYRLAPLITDAGANIQELLLIIFAELPTLDDAEIAEYLLPVALTWAKHPGAEQRRMVTNILARIKQASAQEALLRLERDSNPLVRVSAQRAAAYVKGA